MVLCDVHLNSLKKKKKNPNPNLDGCLRSSESLDTTIHDVETWVPNWLKHSPQEFHWESPFSRNHRRKAQVWLAVLVKTGGAFTIGCIVYWHTLTLHLGHPSLNYEERFFCIPGGQDVLLTPHMPRNGAWDMGRCSTWEISAKALGILFANKTLILLWFAKQ